MARPTMFLQVVAPSVADAHARLVGHRIQLWHDAYTGRFRLELPAGPRSLVTIDLRTVGLALMSIGEHYHRWHGTDQEWRVGRPVPPVPRTIRPVAGPGPEHSSSSCSCPCHDRSPS